MTKRLFAILTALVLMISVSAAFAEETAVPDTLLVTVNGIEIRENNEDLQYFYEYLVAELADPENEDDLHIIRMDVMKSVIENAVIDSKVAEAIPEEEAEKIRGEARESWNVEINKILAEDYGITAETAEEDRTAALADLLTELETYYGITEDQYVESYADYIITEKFSDQVIAQLKEEDPSLTADEEAIRQEISDYIFEEREEVAYYAMCLKLSGEDPAKFDAMTDEERYEIFREMTEEEKYELSNDIYAYESIKNYYKENYDYDFVFHYIPDGYRGITHILLDVDEELMNTWMDLAARYEEGDEETAEGEEPVTAEMVEAARQAILDSRKDRIDEILGKLADGAKFEDLIAEYGSDPGMAEGLYLETGYPIHKDSIAYDAGFTAAAAALAKIGDYSEPVVSRNGIHILYYLRDIPGGALELSEEETEQMKQDIEEQYLNMAISSLVEKWVEEADIVWTAEGEAWKEDEAFREAYVNALYSDAGWDDEEAAQ